MLAGGIAHDFNNLLMSMLGNAALARLELQPDSPADYSVSQIEVAASRAAELTRQMLAYSGRGHFAFESVDLNPLVVEMSWLSRVSFNQNLALEFHLGERLPPLEADPTQLRQLIVSLLANAAEALGATPGTITVSTGLRCLTRSYLASTYLAPDLPSGNYIYLTVADTGPGMDSHTLSRIFEPFFSTKFTGRGLGLPAVLGVVRGHRGALNIHSQPGQGATCTVFLPIASC